MKAGVIRMAPVLDRQSKYYGGKFIIYRPNIDDCPQTAIRYMIMSVPELLF